MARIWESQQKQVEGSVAGEVNVEKLVASVADAVSRGFEKAVDVHLQEVRRTMEGVASAVSGLTRSIEAVKDGQTERKVMFAEMKARIDNAERDVDELKKNLDQTARQLNEATGTINKGIGAALILSVLVPSVITLLSRLWH